MNGIFCTATVYKYKGVLFEYSRRNGPWPLKKNEDPKVYPSKTFWKLWEEFSALTKKQQATYIVQDGGCLKF